MSQPATNRWFFVLLVTSVLIATPDAGLLAQEAKPSDADHAELQQQVRSLTDKTIQLAIEKELLASHAVDGSLIVVQVEDGIAKLSGRVEHLLAEDVAISLVQRIRGVVSVVDLIEVEAQRRPDADLKKDIEAAIGADPATHDLHPTVAVGDGVVSLTGAVATYGEKSLVEQVVKRVTGVLEVKNDLVNARSKEVSDDELRKEISELYQYAVLLDDAKIDVDVKAGNVLLNGVVSTAYQRSQAELLAYRAGATSVDGRGIRISGLHSDRMLREKRYEQATDAEIRDAVLRAWKYDPGLVSESPKIAVVKGNVTLTGKVGDLPAKLAAERIARFTIGVRAIQNDLNVSWPDENPSDEAIANNVQEAIRRDPYVDPANIRITVEDAHVGLYGIVENEFEKEHAQWTASRQIGVVHIDNSLSVRAKWVKKSDEAIAADLKDRLEITFIDPDNQVTAKVDNGVALLQGTVDSWFMWQTALDQALAAGAREPHMMVEVRYGEGTVAPYYGTQYYIPR